MWYIDAWDVPGGVAFASRRELETGSGRADEHVSATVHLAAPYFEPTSVASRATALSATRGAFQWGFFGPDGEEVGFDTLAELREAVRRAYIASAGPDIMPPVPEGTPPLRPLDGGTEALADIAERIMDLIGKQFESVGERQRANQNYREQLSSELLLFVQKIDSTTIGGYVGCILDRFYLAGTHSYDSSRDFFSVVRVAESLGFLSEVSECFHNHLCWPICVLAPNFRQVSPDILFWIPLPQSTAFGGVPIKSIGDLLVRALADRNAFAPNKRTTPAYTMMLPLLLAAAFASHLAPNGGDLQHPDARLAQGLERAAMWLVRELPDYSQKVVVEQAIEGLLAPEPVEDAEDLADEAHYGNGEMRPRTAAQPAAEIQQVALSY